MSVPGATQPLTSSVHLSAAPRTHVSASSLRTIGTGLTQVESMYTEMKELELRKDQQISDLRRRVETLESSMLDADERVAFLVAASEKLERKIARRDQTIERLEQRLREANSAVISAREENDRLAQVLKAAERSATQANRVCTEALDALRTAEATTDALAVAEQRALACRSVLLQADHETLRHDELAMHVQDCIAAYAEVGFQRSALGVAACRAQVTAVLQDVAKPAHHSCNAVLESLRVLADDIASTTRAVIVATALGSPLIAAIRRAIRSTACSGECTLIAHRVFGVVEAELTKHNDLLDQSSVAGKTS